MSPLLRSLSEIAVKRLFRTAVLEQVDELAEHVRLLRLVGDDLRGVTWVPGQKLQLRIEGFTTRTFTPIHWDAQAGVTSIVAAMHGSGPGADYVGGMQAGQACQFFGPRSSIDLSSITGLVLMAGDETSIGLAVAAKSVEGLTAEHALETSLPQQTQQLLDALDVRDAVLLPPEPEDALARHVLDVVERSPEITVVLTGRAQSIRKVRSTMKQSGAHRGRTIVRSYWDENRAGLD